ncbi:Protein N-terminal amidase [Golovinomyces cichoracearum]|uniref:Protein N-terminal amidase n=1 Tax=Golovinomyces cichoracearum TaxID=62708 RepID=A0A420I5E4_9PEZI|nr:Protein N-terminal amidase [Golovinomyces cichoracearum]
MKIACLQFVPVQGDIAGSIAKAEYLLRDLHPQDVNLLLLPELAFAGYNFPSLEAIRPFLEPTHSGPSSTWARNTAQRLGSFVSVGYAETTDFAFMKTLGNPAKDVDRQKNFNSNVTFGPDGNLVAHYRKHFLYMTDESWCVEGSERFFVGEYPAPINQRVAMGICMDINPYHFTAPWSSMEFANHACDVGAELVLLSMAWSSFDLSRENVLQEPEKSEPDWETVKYWFGRFQPLIQVDRSVIIVMGNRSGVEKDVVYTGSSLIARIGRDTVEIWDIAGKGEERLVVVDTDTKPVFMWKAQDIKPRVNEEVNV